MPRCQRTFRRLGEGTCRSGGVREWRCPFCPEAEAYSPVASDDLLAYAAQAETYCRTEFGAPSDRDRPTLLLYGLRPECILEPDDRRYDLYLAAGSDPYQLRLQIGHEMFHRVCSQGRVFHWIHEMFACLVSVRLLHRSGFSEYAAQIAGEYASQAAGFTAEEMLRSDLAAPPYPAGLYGRAFVTGMALKDAAGWPALCRLSRLLDRADTPDLASWLRQLPVQSALAVERVLMIGDSGDQPGFTDPPGGRYT